MKDLIEIRKFVLENGDDNLTLCTLVRKQGSSYRPLGAKKVVSSDKSCGLLSGGCLEASIEKAARERRHEMPFIESFSTLAEEDRLLGYQTGCQGVIDILFEKIPVPGFEILEKSWFEKLDVMIPFGPRRPAWGVAVNLDGPELGRREFLSVRPEKNTAKNIFYEEWCEPLHLVIVGCGPDADAYMPLVTSMGWSLEFMDYRRSFVSEERFQGHPARCISLESIASNIPQGDRVAVILMTHNYEADLEIMRGLRFHRLGYVGCLGPARRYESIKKDMLDLHGEIISEHLQAVIHAPMGIFTNSHSPESIALSTVAHIQDKLIEQHKDSVWSVILAAGASRRFGSAKALAPWDGGTLLSRAIQTCQEVTNSSSLVVTGSYNEKISEYLGGLLYAYNSRWEEGMGTSISCGVRAVMDRDPNAKYIVILPVDQPFADTVHIRRLIQESQKTGRCVLTEGQGFMGPPAVLPQRFFENALKLRGEQGLKKVLDLSDITAVKNFVAAQDFDSPEELKSAQIRDV